MKTLKAILILTFGTVLIVPGVKMCVLYAPHVWASIGFLIGGAVNWLIDKKSTTMVVTVFPIFLYMLVLFSIGAGLLLGGVAIIKSMLFKNMNTKIIKLALILFGIALFVYSAFFYTE